MQPILRSFEAKVDDVSPNERAIVAKISTSAVDRYNTAFEIRGCDLRSYNNNRVCLWEHGRCPMRGSLPIGRNLWIRVDKGGGATRMIAKTQFKEDEFSDQLYQDYSAGFLNAWSISVLPSDFGPPRADEIRARPELKDVETIFRKFELCEYSATAVPGNPECTVIKEDTARALNNLVVRGFYIPPAEIKEQIDRAMTEGGGLSSGGALVKPDCPDDSDDDDDKPKPKKRKAKPDCDDDAPDCDDDAETVDEGITTSGGGMAQVGMSGPDDAVTPEDAAPEPVTRDVADAEIVAPEPAVEIVVPEPPAIELPPLTGRSFQQVFHQMRLMVKDHEHRMQKKVQDHIEWLQGKA